MTKTAFITTFCPHHRRKTFKILGSYHPTDYYFFSSGDEWYWQSQHGVETGAFHYEYLRGARIGRTRFAPSLPFKLWRGKYDAYIKCINGRFALPVTYLVALLRRKPFILWTGIWMRLQTPFHRLFFPVTRYIYRHADAIVVYGEHVKKFLVAEGVSEEKIFVAPHAVDNSQFNVQVPDDNLQEIRNKLNIKPDHKVVLYLGRLEEVKGLPYLIDAFASLESRDAVLVIAGTGSQAPYLKQLADDKAIVDKVRFPGYIPQEESVLYYTLAWVYVLPSITTPVFKEPWGLVVNEAFNQKVPVITTEAVGAAAGGLVQDGVNGFIVPERDSQALAQAIGKVLGDPGLRDRLSTNARAIITGWDNENMVAGFQRAIEFVTLK